MIDICKCSEPEKYCKDCKSCIRYTMPASKFQSYAQLHECKKTDKEKCDFYIKGEVANEIRPR